MKITSLPTRERGLKPYEISKQIEDKAVAPHAGAWIETSCQQLQID